MTVTFVSFLLVISVSLNVVFIWYIRKLIQEFRYLMENADDTMESLNDFTQHLERLYELETYYGDESLKNLIRHSKSILEEIKDFEVVVSSVNKETDLNEEKKQ